jgi:hypothetical protein
VEFDAQPLAKLYDTQISDGWAKNIKPNLDYRPGPAYSLIGYDTEMFTPLLRGRAGSPAGPRTSWSSSPRTR